MSNHISLYALCGMPLPTTFKGASVLKKKMKFIGGAIDGLLCKSSHLLLVTALDLTLYLPVQLLFISTTAQESSTPPI